MKTIEVTINADGSVTIETNGFAGAECERATAELESAMGGKRRSRRLKPERFAQVRAGQEAKQR